MLIGCFLLDKRVAPKLQENKKLCRVVDNEIRLAALLPYLGYFRGPNKGCRSKLVSLLLICPPDPVSVG